MSRRLAGSLEDLGPEEVMRVVTLSKRSGVLWLKTQSGHAELLYQAGRLYGVRRGPPAPTLAAHLVKAGALQAGEIADPATLELSVLELQQQLFGDGEEGAMRLRLIDAAILRGIDDAVRALRRESRGSFAFDAEKPEQVGRDRLGDTLLLSPLFRVAAAPAPQTPGVDGNAGTDDEESIDAAELREATDLPIVYVVSPDAEFRDGVEQLARRVRVRCVGTVNAREGLDALDILADDETSLMVVDLQMPRASGRGFLGGLEVVRGAQLRGCASRVYLALEEAHDDAMLRAAELGAAGASLRVDAGRAPELAWRRLLAPIFTRLGRSPLPERPSDLLDRLRDELLDDVDEWERQENAVVDAEGSLRGMKALLGEMNAASFEGEIPLLVLRFVAAFFSRAALLEVREDTMEFVGLGAYGLTAEDAGRAIHKVRLRFDQDNLFRRCVREAQGVIGPYVPLPANEALLAALGTVRPSMVFAAPVFSAQGLEAVLYADNGSDDMPEIDLALLDVFLMQAGASLERWRLAQRVAAMENEAASAD
ncbi:MAG: DUF4388 domain-containing protein [Myxococcota bacterium]